MTRTELIKRIMDNHNRIATIQVHGEGAILVAATLRDLRHLFNQLQTESIEEEEGLKLGGD